MSLVAEASLSEAVLVAKLFPAGGEMGQRIRQLDWAATALGPVHSWPQSLRTAVGIMLGSRFPMMVHWGPALVHFYNDGYAAILQGKHPGALGQPAEPWWREIWPFLQTIFAPVLAGETTYFENSLVLPNRQGFVEEAYFTFSHSPIYTEDGTVGGIFVTALETTGTVVQQQRLALLSHLTAQTTLVAAPAEAAQHIIAALSSDPADVPFALLYAHQPGEDHAQLRGWFGLPAGEPTAPTRIDLHPAHPEAGWGGPVAEALGQGQPVHLTDLGARFIPWPPGNWAEAPTQALVLPLTRSEATLAPHAVLIAGLNPRRPFDEAHRAFFELLADYAGRALSRAAAVQEAQRLNLALQQVNASLDAFVHIVAHDLRGPTTNLHELLRVYHEEEPGPARDHLVQLLEQEVGRLSATLRGLLQVLQAQYGASAEPSAVDLPELLAKVQAELTPLQQQLRGSLSADLQAAAIVRGYPRAHLESILKNLVHNALKYRHPERSPVVLVRSRREAGAVVLSVSDNGQGIDLARNYERLFQPFTRLSAEGEGAGLGLHIIRTLVQQRGGKLEVSSTPGVGTTFTATLPEPPSY